MPFGSLVLPGTVYVVILSHVVGIQVFVGTGGRSGQEEGFPIVAADDFLQHGDVRVGSIHRRPVGPGELISPAPEGQAGMMHLGFYGMDGGFTAQIQKFRQFGGFIIHPGAGLNEFLPHHQPQLVTGIVKRFAFDEAAAPHPDQVDPHVPGQR